MNSNQLPVSGGVAIFIAVIISYFTYSPEDLSGVRPNDSRVIEQVHGDQDVQARLWQDPFAAVAIHKHSKEKSSVQIRLTGEVIIPPLDEKKPMTAKIDINPSKDSDSDKLTESKPHSFNNLAEQIANEFRESNEPGEPRKQVNVLSVMVSAGPYPEDEEGRLRRRYAVIAGLAASGYQPEDAAHIGYVEDLPSANCSREHPDDILLPAVMPYEWFKNAEDESYSLLLWLDEDAFARNPLCKLNFLVENVTERTKDALSKLSGSANLKNGLDIKFKIIGPSSSGTLKAMVKELEKRDSNNQTFSNLMEKAQFFSAMATAQDSKLISDVGWNKNNGDLDLVEQKFKEHNLVLFRSIASDGYLANVLAAELNKRIYDFWDLDKRENFQIALVSEWDTFYGRALPDAFVDSARDMMWKSVHLHYFDKLWGKAWGSDLQRRWEKVSLEWKRAKDKWEQSSLEWKQAKDKWEQSSLEWKRAKDKWRQAKYKWKRATLKWEKKHIYRFSYLRGIDGRIADKTQKVKSSNQDAKQRAELNAMIERPEGRSQRDYLRRLASDMQLRDQQLKNEGKKGIRAIGILGSDVYDKLMILRVLRQRFPKAFFFTTDLDASLLHPAEFRWARNMLVASSFDLKIADHKEIQRTINQWRKGSLKRISIEPLVKATEATIPQFRDVYQTSVYLSTLWATNKELGKASRIKNISLFKTLMTKSYNEAKEAEKKAKAAAKEADGNAKDVNAIAQEAKERVDKIEADKQDMADAQEAEKQAKTAVKKAEDEARTAAKKAGDKAKTVAQEAEEQAKAAAKDAEMKMIMLESYRLFNVLFKKNLDPKVYEIGRYGAVELPRKDSLATSPFYPAKPSTISPRSLVMGASCLVLLALLAFIFWRRWLVILPYGDDLSLEAPGRYADWWAIGIAFFALFILFAPFYGPILFIPFYWSYVEVFLGKYPHSLIFTGYLLVAFGYAFLVRRVMQSRPDRVAQSCGGVK